MEPVILPRTKEKPVKPYSIPTSLQYEGSSKRNQSVTVAPKMIINKNKIEELKNNHIIPQNIETFLPVASPQKSADTGGASSLNVHKRVVLPPKARLGNLIKANIKERLGPVSPEKSNCEIYELEDVDYLSDQDEVTQEERSLREVAIKTLDLRKRLSKKEPHFRKNNANTGVIDEVRMPQIQTDSKEPSLLGNSDSEDYNDDSYTEHRTVAKKHKKSKLKKEKKKKEKNKEHKISKLKIKKHKLVKLKKDKSSEKGKSAHKMAGREITSEVSLAVKIAREREGRLFSQNIGNATSSELSSLELYMQKMKKKKRKKLLEKMDQTEMSDVPLDDDNYENLETMQIKNMIKEDTKIASVRRKIESKKSTKPAKDDNQKGSKKRKHENQSMEITNFVPQDTNASKICKDNKRAKILKPISDTAKQKEKSVRSVLNDVDSLLNSAENQKILETTENYDRMSDKSKDVMKQLDELINS